MSQRKKRFQRSPDGRVQLTERDLALIQHVHRHRFLSSVHLRALADGSGQGVLRRLNALYHAGYLDRPREQLEHYRAGSRPMVYGLGNKGADLLREEFGVLRGRMDWTSKNREVKRPYLEHTLAIADIVVALEVATRAREDVCLLSADDILAASPEATRKEKRPLSWRTNFSIGGTRHSLTLKPDAIFGLHFLNEPEGKNRAFFFLEVDRGTMPVMRSDLRQTSMYRKYLSYYTSLAAKVHLERYGMRSIRILTVTTSPERLESCLAAQNKAKQVLASPVVEGHFYFATRGALSAKTVLEHEWQVGGGKTGRL